MSVHVYLAGPINGCTRGEANNWRDSFANRLAPAIIGVSPLRCEPLIGSDRYGGCETAGKPVNELYSDPRFGVPKAIKSKNYIDVHECDVMVAYLPKEANDRRPSYGTIMEIAWAHEARKPVILVSDDPAVYGHPVIAESVQWIVSTLDEAYDIIQGVYGVYA